MNLACPQEQWLQAMQGFTSAPGALCPSLFIGAYHFKTVSNDRANDFQPIKICDVSNRCYLSIISGGQRFCNTDCASAKLCQD